MKFKVGDRVSFIDQPDHTGTLLSFHKQFATWAMIHCDQCVYPRYYLLDSLTLKEENQKMQNKNELVY